MIQLCFYVPESHVERVKEAVFKAGAGRIGNYEQCAWQVLGEGQFRPMRDSTPFLGSEGELERVPEFRVEMVCDDELIEPVVAALRDAHPYEEPAFSYWAINAER
ncbi:MAG: NGG1p interacting factor NIF3 [Proteobacteria bacterium]|nr:NGG1p interacting factor NIF3 [Pseudomonadota bacterium]